MLPRGKEKVSYFSFWLGTFRLGILTLNAWTGDAGAARNRGSETPCQKRLATGYAPRLVHVWSQRIRLPGTMM